MDIAKLNYTSENDTFLNMEEETKGNWVIRWDYPDTTGVHVGIEFSKRNLDSKSDWEVYTANEAARPYAENAKDTKYCGFYFSSKEKCLEAKLAIIKALHSETWIPTWAKIATEEGWLPPEGWKPKRNEYFDEDYYYDNA